MIPLIHGKFRRILDGSVQRETEKGRRRMSWFDDHETSRMRAGRKIAPSWLGLGVVTGGLLLNEACTTVPPSDGFGPPTASPALTCDDFNALYAVSVRTSTTAVDGGLEDVDAGDASADAGDAGDAADASAFGRHLTTVVIQERNPLTETGWRVVLEEGDEQGRNVATHPDAGVSLIDWRRLRTAAGYRRLEVDLDTTSTRRFVLRITNAVRCRVADPSIDPLRPALLDVRLLESGRADTIRATVEGTDVPVPITANP